MLAIHTITYSMVTVLYYEHCILSYWIIIVYNSNTINKTILCAQMRSCMTCAGIIMTCAGIIMTRAGIIMTHAGIIMTYMYGSHHYLHWKCAQSHKSFGILGYSASQIIV